MAAAIRTGALVLWVVAATFVLGVAAIGVSCFSKSGNGVHRIARIWGRSILAVAGVRVRVTGGEALDREKPAIYMANHQSNFDIPVLLAHLPVQFRWIAKAELFRIPIMGRAMRGGGYIPIDRRNRSAAFQSLQEAAERVRGGKSIVIFPEGTRSPDGRLKPFKKGGFMLAIASGVPIVPVAIDGTFEIMPKARLLVRPREVSLRVGRPIEVAGFTRENKDRLMTQVAAALEALRPRQGS
jgi:1-acyl-sn-glycerol-3-phosphate acyltransferase